MNDCPVSRLRNATTRGKRGSGLGLFLCKQIAELHGGSVLAESEPGPDGLYPIPRPGQYRVS